jgi:archaeal cell division control protein 6
MSLFDNMLSENESLFTDEYTLDFSYIPELLPYRENQQKYIAECIKPLAKERAGTNLLISGAPGIGKTSCVKFVFSELVDKTDEIKPVFINCWKNQTTNSVLTEIASQLGVIGSQFKNNDDLWEQIFRVLARFKGIVMALDEVDKAKDYDFLYQIAENLKRYCLVMITNEKDFLANMDLRIRSRLVVEELKFPAYKTHEIGGILKERRNAAFVEGVWSPEAFDLVVEKCSARGDIRIGLVLMREAGRAAEKSASRKITVEHVMGCKASMVDSALESGDLEERERILLRIIRENKGIETGKLSEVLKGEGYETADSTLRRVLQKLDKGGYIFREASQSENGGQTMRHFVDE